MLILSLSRFRPHHRVRHRVVRLWRLAAADSTGQRGCGEPPRGAVRNSCTRHHGCPSSLAVGLPLGAGRGHHQRHRPAVSYTRLFHFELVDHPMPSARVSLGAPRPRALPPTYPPPTGPLLAPGRPALVSCSTDAAKSPQRLRCACPSPLADGGAQAAGGVFGPGFSPLPPVEPTQDKCSRGPAALFPLGLPTGWHPLCLPDGWAASEGRLAWP